MLTGDDLLWNWARWTWTGGPVGNMDRFIHEDEDPGRAISESHAQQVEALHQALPHHERMAVIAEYPQKNAMFGDLPAHQRRARARRWIARVTGVSLTDAEYQLYVGLFRDLVEREVR